MRGRVILSWSEKQEIKDLVADLEICYEIIERLESNLQDAFVPQTLRANNLTEEEKVLLNNTLDAIGASISYYEKRRRAISSRIEEFWERVSP